jgi:5-oxoprolinase (ATP-hydrolysing)/N-methylhydantoinase A
MNCRYPAAVNIRTVSGWYCAPAVFGALAPALPDRVQSFTGLPMGAGAYGYERDGRRFNDSLLQGGGLGGSAQQDGPNAVLFPTSAANTSIEIYESRTPLLVECKELIPDSGGPGRHRGGLGQRLRIRKLYEDGRPVLFSLTPHGIGVDTPGLFGGQPGKRGTVRLENSGGIVAVDDDLAGEPELRDTEHRIVLELAGGSGYGPPGERPVEQVQADFDRGLVSDAGLADYGCRVGELNRVIRGLAT